jgi:hypothetical protein
MKKLLLSTAAVALLITACGDDDDEPTAQATTTTTAGPTTTETPPQSTTTTTTAVVQLVDPADTARAWIAEIGGGDDDDAIALTAPRSLEAIGGPEGFVENETALAEGWGAWDFAEELEVTAVQLDASTAIVLLHGLVAQEGPPREAWAAMPVVATENGDRVEPFLDLGTVEADPPGGATVEPDPRFAAYVLGGRDVQFIVDTGQPVVPALQSADGDQQLGELDVSGLEPGLHVLTVVVRRDGDIMTRTFEYAVEG